MQDPGCHLGGREGRDLCSARGKSQVGHRTEGEPECSRHSCVDIISQMPSNHATFSRIFGSIHLFLRRAGTLTDLGLLNRLNRVASKPWRATCRHFTGVSIVSACYHCWVLLFICLLFIGFFLALNRIWGSNLETHVCFHQLQLYLSKSKDSHCALGILHAQSPK